MTEQKNPFDEAPAPSLIPEMLSDHDVALIVKSQLHREEQTRKANTDKKRRKLAKRVSRQKGVAVGVGLSLALTGGAVGRHELKSSKPKREIAPAGYIAVKEVTAKPGDTVWGIMQSAKPNSDVRPAVDHVEKEMQGDIKLHVDGGLQPGYRVVLPPDSKVGKPEVIPSDLVDDVPFVDSTPPAPEG